MAREKRRSRRGFGAVRLLPSGRYQASVTGPDLRRYPAPWTFETKLDADEWLVKERRLLVSGEWTPPRERRSASSQGVTLAEYAPGSLERRRVKGEPLRRRTIALYRSLLDRVILPELGHLPLSQVTPDKVTAWYDALPRSTPTQRAHAYSLLRTVMGQAVTERLVSVNPCQIVGAGRTTRVRRVEVATPEQLVSIAQGMPEHLRLLVLMAAWCALRFGELAELRRGDVDTARGVVSIERAVVRVDGENIIGLPKSAAGVRVVAIPPHLLPVVADHLAQHVGPATDALVFPRRPGVELHLTHTELTKKYTRAREAAGRPDLRLHDLRHTGAVLSAQAGATLAELMARLGHSTPGAAMRYQHAAAGRDAQIAAAMSRLAEGGDTPEARAY